MGEYNMFTSEDAHKKMADDKVGYCFGNYWDRRRVAPSSKASINYLSFVIFRRNINDLEQAPAGCVFS